MKGKDINRNIDTSHDHLSFDTNKGIILTMIEEKFVWCIHTCAIPSKELYMEVLVYFYFAIKSATWVPCHTALSCVTSTSTMQRPTELLLLLVTFTLPLFFVNGLQQLGELQPSIKNDSLQTEALIGGLLYPRQFFCNPGFGICETRFCCPVNWHCCRGSSLSPSLSLVPLSN